jgi:hypothetical protein
MNGAYLTQLREGAAAPHGATSSGSSLLVGLVTTAVVLVPIALVLFVWLRGGHGGAEGEDGNPGWGGGGSRPSGPDGPRGLGGEPAWWPEFERQFAAWVQETATPRPSRFVPGSQRRHRPPAARTSRAAH